MVIQFFILEEGFFCQNSWNYTVLEEYELGISDLIAFHDHHSPEYGKQKYWDETS